MKLFAGIDGGQTSTIAVVADDGGTIVGRGIAGPCDHIGQSPDSRRFAQALEDAVGDALRDASLPQESSLTAVVAGISGYEGELTGVAPRLRSKRVRYVHDAVIAHAAAFAQRAGIVIVAGTGSVAYGRDPSGAEATVGGWGFLFGDEGSAFSIARSALSAAMRAQDAGERSTLAEAARRFFGTADLRALARDFYLERIDRPMLAGFATCVLPLAEAGEAQAAAVVRSAAASLAGLAAACAARLEWSDAPGVALVGGTFASVHFRAEVASAIAAVLPQSPLAHAAVEPAEGAVFLARTEKLK